MTTSIRLLPFSLLKCYSTKSPVIVTNKFNIYFQSLFFHLSSLYYSHLEHFFFSFGFSSFLSPFSLLVFPLSHEMLKVLKTRSKILFMWLFTFGLWALSSTPIVPINTRNFSPLGSSIPHKTAYLKTAIIPYSTYDHWFRSHLTS